MRILVSFLRASGSIGRPVGAWITCGILFAAVGLITDSAVAQGFGLKYPASEALLPRLCPVISIPPVGSVAEPTTIDSLLAAGSRAAILGDNEAAGEFLREASTLDPANPIVSYRLARALDDQGEAEAAVGEYCRYLALGPDAGGTGEVEARIRELAPDGFDVPTDPWMDESVEGIEAYERGRYDDAVDAFTRAIELEPDEPDVYFNRAIALIAADRQTESIRDFETYLYLRPDAEDRLVVQMRLGGLRNLAALPPAPVETVPEPLPPLTIASPASAFVQGLVLPGLGQHATGRTGLGLLFMGGVGGALYYAFQQEVVVRTRQAMDPFGNPYEYEVRSLERPNQTVGIGAAVTIAVVGAIESLFYARTAWSEHSAAIAAAAGDPNAGEARLRLQLESDDDRVRVGLRVPFP